MSKPLWGLSLVGILGLVLWVPSYAQELSFALTIKDHRFEPSELRVPAGKRFKLVVKNLDPTAEEFESHDLKLEKVIPGRSEANLTVRPLRPGTYEFVGEFHEKTARGRVVAK
ncbi:MAG TPA: cupredoxin domain-containing protein [Burkholderiales bacterium]|nr:cupredoxin domain-containing protein [Burkholderiales bacterium]